MMFIFVCLRSCAQCCFSFQIPMHVFIASWVFSKVYIVLFKEYIQSLNRLYDVTWFGAAYT